MIKFVTKLGFFVLSLSTLPGCSTLADIDAKKMNPINWFKDDKGVEPTPLKKISEEVKFSRVWREKIGDGQGEEFLRLQLAIDNKLVFAASSNGIVEALEIDSGRSRWRVKTKEPISGGVGYSSGRVAVGTENSQVIVFDAESGEQLWDAKVSSEVLSVPALNNQVVIVQTQDGKLIALDAEDGSERWIYESTVPALSLRGTSSPLIQAGFVLAALGNGSVISVALDNGTLRWEERVAIPTGRSEIDRLVDIDGEMKISDNGLLLVSSYQGYFSAIDVTTGQTRWRTKASTYSGPDFGFGNVYIVDSEDSLRAFRVGQEQPIWENSDFLHRTLSSPLAFNNYLVVADFEGYIQVLTQTDGRVVGRIKTGSKGVRASMLYKDGKLFVYGNGGELAVYQLQ